MAQLRTLGLVALSLLALCACRQEAPRPWIPVLEQTGFSHLHDAVDEARLSLEQARDRLRAGETGPAGRELEQAHHALLKLEHYFLPMTQVRQLVYDADRLYYLGRKEETSDKLRQSRQLLLQMGLAGGESVERAVSEVIALIEDLERAMVLEPQAVTGKMRLLGEKINLMVLKGDLVLAGAKFPQEQ